MTGIAKHAGMNPRDKIRISTETHKTNTAHGMSLFYLELQDSFSY